MEASSSVSVQSSAWRMRKTRETASDSKPRWGHGLRNSFSAQAGENITHKVKGQRKEMKKGGGEGRKEKGKGDGQLDLLRVKSIKVHQIQNSCFFKVTNMCWKLRKTKGK